MRGGTRTTYGKKQEMLMKRPFTDLDTKERII
jgi:hypothetical protein